MTSFNESLVRWIWCQLGLHKDGSRRWVPSIQQWPSALRWPTRSAKDLWSTCSANLANCTATSSRSVWVSSGTPMSASLPSSTHCAARKFAKWRPSPERPKSGSTSLWCEGFSSSTVPVSSSQPEKLTRRKCWRYKSRNEWSNYNNLTEFFTF